MRANDKTGATAFKRKTVELKTGADLTASKRHAIKSVTRCNNYSGTHEVEILVNGESLAMEDFELDAD